MNIIQENIKFHEQELKNNMTQRINALTVVLSQDMRVDDAEHLINAIKMLKYVQSVELNVSTIDSHIAYTRARCDIENKLYTALRDDTK